MSTAPHLLAIVPARRGSKGVPGKNIRLIAGKPLFAHTVQALVDAGVAERLVVATDDPIVVRWCAEHDVEVFHRVAAVSGDKATIADVALQVQSALAWTGTVGVFQPTSPLRTGDSIRTAWQEFVQGGARSLMSVAREEHLYWLDGDGGPTPLFEERVNRQYARHRVLRETGAIQFIEAEALATTRGMVTDSHHLFELPASEVLDIDTEMDFEFARRSLERRRVIFRLTANDVVGTGHLYHCLRLREAMPEHDAHFLLKDCGSFVQDVIRSRGYSFTVETSMKESLEQISPRPTLVVNDVLDTTEEEILTQKVLGHAVVTVEDLGPGARYADWVVNALYPARGGDVKVATGPEWAPLRPEFLDAPPRQTRDKPQRVLLTFGGADPAGLAPRLAQALQHLAPEVVVVEGAGATAHEYPVGVEVRRDVTDMAAEMLAADLMVTSAGRTVYEAAALGTPLLVLAQNAREATHVHLGYDTGVVFLGLGYLVDDAHVREVAGRILANPQLRAELSHRLQKSVDGRANERIAHHLRGMMRGFAK